MNEILHRELMYWRQAQELWSPLHLGDGRRGRDWGGPGRGSRGQPAAPARNTPEFRSGWSWGRVRDLRSLRVVLVLLVAERHGDRNGIGKPACPARGRRVSAIHLQVSHCRAETEQLVPRGETITVADDIGQRSGVHAAGDRARAADVQALGAAEPEVEIARGGGEGKADRTQRGSGQLHV